MNPCIYLLPVLFRLGATWLPPSAQGNLWQRSPFLLPSPTIDNNFLFPSKPPSENARHLDDIDLSSAPVNSLELSSKMFKLYFQEDKHGVKEAEDFLEYFRHDLGINLYHNNWHNANPFDGPLVQNHRRGESFYFMHQQLLARYNVERIGNGEAPIPSAHDASELEVEIEKKYQLPNYDRSGQGSGCEDSYSQMQNWTNNIIDAILQGYAITMNNYSVPVEVNLLGNMIQPSSATPNGPFYGNIHNMGHNNIAYCHYKGNQKLNIQFLSDLGDTRTAPRSPVFYRFHTFVDDLFKLYQKKLPEHSRDELNYPGVELKSVKIITEKGPTTSLRTFWQMIRMDNFYIRDKLTPEYDIPFHMQHEDFKYEFTIENNSDETKYGMVRIFIAPVYDVKGKKLSLAAQRSLFIELDKFRIKFPAGESTVVRQAEDSAVTVKFDEMFRNTVKGNLARLDPEEANFCSCGWPDYFLLPSGNPKGMKFVLFAMLTEEAEDANDYDPYFMPPNPRAVKQTTCKEAYSYCGLMESRYPDVRPMGYPWDLPAPRWAANLTDFLTPNMLIQEIEIKHFNETVPAMPDIPDYPLGYPKW